MAAVLTLWKRRRFVWEGRILRGWSEVGTTLERAGADRGRSTPHVNARAANDDDEQFEADLVACVPALRAFARSLAGDSSDADDLAQSTLLRALRARRQFTPGTSLKSWLFTILRNQFYNDRRAARRSVALDPEDAERRLVACDDPSAALELNDVRMALMALPPEQREALMLIGGAGLSYEEASLVTGVVVGTVKSRVSRARATLQARLESGKFKRDRLPAQASAAWLMSPIRSMYR